MNRVAIIIPRKEKRDKGKEWNNMYEDDRSLVIFNENMRT